MLGQMQDLTLGMAARAIGVSVDTLRRWDRAGKLEIHSRHELSNALPSSESELTPA